MPEAEAPIEASQPNDRLIHLRRYVASKTCYHIAALPEAVVRGNTDRVAFQIEIWSLMEKREIEWSEKVYAGENPHRLRVSTIFLMTINSHHHRQ